MRKYLYIFKAEFMSKLQYIFDILTGFFVFALMIFVFINLWDYLYSDPSELINGYNMTQMIWYVVVTEVLWMTLKGRELCKGICSDVKSGTIAYKINKPFNYILFTLFSHLGKVFLSSIIYITLAFIFGLIFIGPVPVSIFEFIAVLISGVFSTVISCFLIISIGLISFYIEDAEPFYWVYSKFVLLIGTIFPIEYFPEVTQTFLMYSPIYVLSYGPAKLFVDFSIDTMLNVYIMQIIYIVLSYLLCTVIYKKGARKLNVNGG